MSKFEKPQQPEISNGWKNETEQRKQAIAEFVQKHLPQPENSRRAFNDSELHLSGQNSKVLKKIFKGEANVLEVSVLYKDNEPEQVHVVFDGEGTGHNLDIYLTGKAIEEYFEASQE